MKITKITTSIALLTMVMCLNFVSCKKKAKEAAETVTTTTAAVTDDEQESAKDNNTAEANASDMESIGAQAQEDQSVGLFKTTNGAQVFSIDEIASCGTITYSASIKTLTVDFGTNCVGNDGKTRSGKLIYNWSGSSSNATRYRHPGFNLVMTTSNYVVDSHTISGTHIVTNITSTAIPSGLNPGTNLTWSVVATFTIQKPNTDTVTWSCTRTKELTNTNDTNCYKGQNRAIVWSKAIVKLNGLATGKNASKNNYSSVVNNLVRDMNCTPDAAKPNRHPFINGTIIYTPSGKLPRTINYGSGACDKDATLTIGTNTYTFSLW